MMKGSTMNTMRPNVFQRNKKLAIAVGVLCSGLWLALLGYVLIDHSSSEAYVCPGQVPVRAASPTADNVVTPVPGSRSMESVMMFHHATPATPYIQSFRSTSGARAGNVSMYETSRATVHSVGGGGGSTHGGGNSTAGSSTTGHGLHSTALAYSGTIYIAKPLSALTEVGAGNAQEMASTVTPEPNALPGRRKVNTDPFDPFLTPVGDVVWTIMLLLAGLYGWCIQRRSVKRHTFSSYLP